MKQSHRNHLSPWFPALCVAVLCAFHAQAQSVTVNQGSFSGQTAAGSTVHIWASPNPAGKVFDRWMGDTRVLFDPFSAHTTLLMLVAPGAKLQYSNPGIALLTYCVTAAIRDGAHKDIRTLLGARVLRPVGVPDEEWSVGYGKTFTVDGLPLVGSWGGGNFTLRAVARIGRLVLRQGDWEGLPLLSREAVRRMTGDAGLPGHCGMGWWTNAAGRYAGLPKDAVWGAGAGDQLLLVIPSLNLMMVRNGQTLVPPPPNAPDVFAEFHDPRAKLLFEALVAAITDQPAAR